MTPDQLKKLAEMVGGKRKAGLKHGDQSYYEFPSGVIYNSWHPETSLDHCRPLFNFLTENKLWTSFVNQLLNDEWEGTFLQGIIVAYTQFTPADIVAAFIKTIEEADRKERQ